MFVYCRTVRVQDTDATGSLYFANQLQIGMEAFEEYVLTQGFSIGEMVRKNEISLPVVHAEGDFLSPVEVGDALELHLSFSKIGTTSFTHKSEVRCRGAVVGMVTIVHVVFCAKEKKAIPIPQKIKDLMVPLEKTSRES